MKTKIFLLFLVGSILLSGCVSTTMIQSTPAGAKIYIDDQPVGSTPFAYSDTKIVGSITNVKLVKEGYEPLYSSFSRSEQVDVGAVIGALIFWAPVLWVMKYNPVHAYELAPAIYDNEAVFTPPQQYQAKSKAERLRELKQLLDEKLITQEDYEKEKTKILQEDDK